MKKFLLFIFTLFMFMPINVYAESYTLKDLELSIEDSTLDVFTRDNIKDNAKLDEFGITYDYLNNFMISNDVYLDAVKFYEDELDNIELFVIAKSVNNVSNLHTYNDSDLKEFGDKLKEKIKSNSYKIYSIGKYKYIYAEYYDSSNDYYIIEYYTVMNGYGYRIMMQKKKEFTNNEIDELKKIVDTSKYKYIAKYEINRTNEMRNKIILGGIIGSIIGLISGIIKIIRKKKKKEKSN